MSRLLIRDIYRLQESLDSASGASTGTATLDFGSSPGSNEASVAVTGQTSISAESVADAFIAGGDATADHTANDHRYASCLIRLSCGTPSAGVGFTIYGTSLEKMTGTFAVRWRWQ